MRLVLLNNVIVVSYDSVSVFNSSKKINRRNSTSTNKSIRKRQTTVEDNAGAPHIM